MTARIVGPAVGRYVMTEAEPPALPDPEPRELAAEPEPEAEP